MPRQQIILRQQSVTITDHALCRWYERTGAPIKRTQLKRCIENRLTALARADGIQLDGTGQCRVYVYPWVWAVVKLTEIGWMVTTFKIDRGMVG